MKKAMSWLAFAFLAIAFPLTVCFASIGVGVGTGKIEVSEKLKSGMIYSLPPITVINTGTEASDYATSATYYQDQKELKPSNDWFVFTPQKFNLKPGKVQVVNIKINLPLSTPPGNYFALLEARPGATEKKGRANIGVAAASKLYFTVVPANFFLAIYYRLNTFWQVYAPWPQRALWAIVIVAVIVIAKNFLNINIDLKKPNKGRSKESEKE